MATNKSYDSEPTVNANTNAGALAVEMRKLLQHEDLAISAPKDGSVPAVIVPDGRSLQSVKKLFDEWRTAPERRKGTASHSTIESLVEHVKRFKDDDSALFVDTTPSRPSILAVIDYHQGGPTGAPRFGEHRASYSFPLSEQWKAWSALNEKECDVRTFSKFLEQRIEDMADPTGLAADSAARSLADALDIQFATPSQMLVTSRGLSINVNRSVTEVRNLQSGECQVFFEEAHTSKDGKQLSIPAAFLISIPVVRGGQMFYIAARFGYRVTDDREILFTYTLYRPDRVLDLVIEETVKVAKEGTGLPLFYGTPES